MAEKTYDVRLTESQVRELNDLVVITADCCSNDEEEYAFWEGVHVALNVIPCPACNPIDKQQHID